MYYSTTLYHKYGTGPVVMASFASKRDAVAFAALWLKSQTGNGAHVYSVDGGTEKCIWHKVVNGEGLLTDLAV